VTEGAEARPRSGEKRCASRHRKTKKTARTEAEKGRDSWPIRVKGGGNRHKSAVSWSECGRSSGSPWRSLILPNATLQGDGDPLGGQGRLHTHNKKGPLPTHRGPFLRGTKTGSMTVVSRSSLHPPQSVALVTPHWVEPADFTGVNIAGSYLLCWPTREGFNRGEICGAFPDSRTQEPSYSKPRRYGLSDSTAEYAPPSLYRIRLLVALDPVFPVSRIRWTDSEKRYIC
jgi:hypothetical protein